MYPQMAIVLRMDLEFTELRIVLYPLVGSGLDCSESANPKYPPITTNGQMWPIPLYLLPVL